MALAAAADLNLTGAGTWALASGNTGVGAAAAGDNVDVYGYTLTVKNDGTADDGTGYNSFTLGNVTDTDTGATTGNLTITQTEDAVLTVGITSVEINGDIDIANTFAVAVDRAVVVTVDNNVSAKDISIENYDVFSIFPVSEVVSLDVGGNVTATGNLLVEAKDSLTPEDASLIVTGNLNVTGTSVLKSDTGLGFANLKVGGDATFSTALEMKGGDFGSTTLTLDGTSSAQSVTGAINVSSGSDNYIHVMNAAGVTFNGAITGVSGITVAVSDDNSNSMAIFKKDVTAENITLGNGAGTNTNTVTFDAAEGDFTVNAFIDGTANDTSNVVITGGNKVIAAFNWGMGTPLDNVNIAATGTLEVNTAKTITSAVNFTGDGTVDLIGTASITGAVDNTSGGAGVGTLTSTIATGGTTTFADAIGGTNSLKAVTLKGAGTLTFSNDVAATTISTTAAGTLDFNGDVTGNVSLFVGSTADLVASKNITGTVDGAGTLTLGGGNTVTGTVGAGTPLASITANGTLVTTFNSAVNATTITNSNTAGIVFGDALTVSGAIVNTNPLTLNGTGSIGSISGAGSVTLNGAATIGSSTSSGALAINSANIVSITGTSTGSTLNTVAGSTLNIGGNATFSGIVTNAGRVNLASGVTLTSGGTGIAGAGAYDFEISNGTGSSIDNGDDAINLSTNAVTVTVNETQAQLDSGGSAGAYTIVATTDTTTAVLPVNTLTDTYFYTFAIADNSGDVQVRLTSTTNTMASALTGNGTVAINNAIMGADTSQVVQDTYLAAITAAPTASAVNAIAESYQPAITANTQASVDAILNAASVNSSRIESQTMALRGGSNKYALNQSVTGVATGEASKNLQGWGQVFGQRADQGDRDGQFGYTANTYGIVLGFDTSMVNDSLLGVALTYSRTKVDADNNSDTTINNYQFSFYGQYDITETTFVRGQAGYARGKNDVTSSTLGDANYDSNQFLVQAELGRNFEVMKNLTVTPSIGNNFVHYSADSYTQTAGPVNPDSLNINEITSKVAVSYNHDLGQGSFLQPNAYLGYRYDIIGAKASSTSSVGGSAVFETPGVTPARGTISAGVGVLYTLTDSVDLSANVDYQHKSAFNSYGGSLKAAYRF